MLEMPRFRIKLSLRELKSALLNDNPNLRGREL